MLVWSVFSILPKCVFVVIVIYAYVIDISQGSVKRIYGVVGYVIITLLQIVCRVCQWKNFENRSIVDEDINKSKVPHFFMTHPVKCTFAEFFLIQSGGSLTLDTSNMPKACSTLKTLSSKQQQINRKIITSLTIKTFSLLVTCTTAVCNDLITWYVFCNSEKNTTALHYSTY